MSLIDELGDNHQYLPDIIERYEKNLLNIEADLAIEGKRLERANLEQASHLSWYDQKRIELWTLVKYFEQDVDRIRGKLWMQYTQNMSIQLQSKDKDQYINNEVAYLTANELLLEVTETYKKYEAAVDAFRQRGFALRNITNLRVSQLEDVAI